jgi:hypothetical protein
MDELEFLKSVLRETVPMKSSMCWREIILENINGDEIRQQFLAIQQQQQFECGGFDSYSGTFTTCNSLEIFYQIFDSYEEARETLRNRAKYRTAEAVKFRAKKVKIIGRLPTFHEKKEWGAPYEIYEQSPAKCCRKKNKQLAYADQLTDAQKYQLHHLQLDHGQKLQLFLNAQKEFHTLVSHLQDLNEDFAHFTKLRSDRKRLKKLKRALGKAADKFREVDDRFALILYKEKEVDLGIKWLLGGLCAC